MRITAKSIETEITIVMTLAESRLLVEACGEARKHLYGKSYRGDAYNLLANFAHHLGNAEDV